MLNGCGHLGHKTNERFVAVMEMQWLYPERELVYMDDFMSFAFDRAIDEFEWHDGFSHPGDTELTGEAYRDLIIHVGSLFSEGRLTTSDEFKARYAEIYIDDAFKQRFPQSFPNA